MQGDGKHNQQACQYYVLSFHSIRYVMSNLLLLYFCIRSGAFFGGLKYNHLCNPRYKPWVLNYVFSLGLFLFYSYYLHNSNLLYIIYDLLSTYYLLSQFPTHLNFAINPVSKKGGQCQNINNSERRQQERTKEDSDILATNIEKRQNLHRNRN